MRTSWGARSRPSRFVNVRPRSGDIRFLESLATSFTDGDEVTILPAVAGG